MPSNSRKWVWIVAGTLLLVAASTLYVVLGRGPHEPVYEGIGLSTWLDGSVNGNGLGSARKMIEILRSVGPEALPWLTHTFEINNGKEGLSKLHRRYIQFYQANPKARFFLPAPPIPRWEIAHYNTLLILARLAPGTPYEQRVLRELLSDYDRDDRELAKARLRPLGSFTNSPALVVPVLLAALSNPATTDASIESLRFFGAFASGPLYQMAEKETGFIRPAESALEKVDPAAYYRLRQEKNRF